MPSGTATVLQSSAATISGTKATLTLKAGTDGKDYKVTVTATLDTGTPAYVLEDEFTLRVRQR